MDRVLTDEEHSDPEFSDGDSQEHQIFGHILRSYPGKFRETILKRRNVFKADILTDLIPLNKKIKNEIIAAESLADIERVICVWIDKYRHFLLLSIPASDERTVEELAKDAVLSHWKRYRSGEFVLEEFKELLTPYGIKNPQSDINSDEPLSSDHSQDGYSSEDVDSEEREDAQPTGIQELGKDPGH